MPLVLTSKADLKQELLTLLSPTPSSIDDVAHDLRVSETSVRLLVARLQKKGFAIETADDPAGPVVFINPAGWLRAKVAGEKYFDRMYG